ncbi:MAG: carboxypeptidase-like regulatory domain-containing protein [Gemmataceae bacterium]
MPDSPTLDGAGPGMYLIVRIIVVGLCVLPLSCSRGGGAATATVRGKVTFQGRPLAGGVIVFSAHPDKGTPGTRASAEIDNDGEYRLAVNGSPYLPPGWYRIAVAEPATTAVDAGFPTALRRPDRSGVDREVLGGKENVFEFHIMLP